jgi:hypothetical protein
MDKETATFLGKILGEIYRIQRDSDQMSCGASDSQIYALRNGFEHAAREELERVGYVSEADLKSVMDVLDPIWLDKTRLEKFNGFYDIEDDLKEKGVDRYTAIRILRYLYSNHQFVELIKKMDSSGSPAECRRFELDEWD